jgi:nitrite reductase/ring-hydroxylating ferredoxin subunit
MTWFPACKAADVDDGEAVVVERLPDPPIAVFNVAGDFYAIDDTCTHEEYSLADGYIDADVVECPLHMAKFSICTGKALCLPATRDLAAYPVKVEDGVVLVDLG